jgi:hypothetical protein
MVNSKIQEVFRLFQPTRIHDAIVFPGTQVALDFQPVMWHNPEF